MSEADVASIVQQEQAEHREAAAYVRKTLDGIIVMQARALRTLERYVDRTTTPVEGRQLLQATQQLEKSIGRAVATVQVCNRDSLDRAQLLHCVDIDRLKRELSEQVGQIQADYQALEPKLAALQTWRRAAQHTAWAWAKKARDVMIGVGKLLWKYRAYLAVSYMVLSFLTGPAGWLQTVWNAAAGPMIRKALSFSKVAFVWLCEYYVPEIAVSAVAYMTVTLFTREKKPFLQLIRRLQRTATGTMRAMLKDMETEVEETGKKVRGPGTDRRPGQGAGQATGAEAGMLTAVSYIADWYRPAIAIMMQEFCHASASLVDGPSNVVLEQAAQAVDGLYQYWQTFQSVRTVAGENETTRGIKEAAGTYLGGAGAEAESGVGAAVFLPLAGLAICLYTIVWYGKESEKNKAVQHDLIKFQVQEAVDLSRLVPVKKTTVTHSQWRKLQRAQQKTRLLAVLNT
jgi:hypothetical protein